MSALTLQIYILSRDRVDYLRQTLNSVLAQRGDAIEVVVSDNSEHDDVSQMLAIEFPQTRRVRRWPALGAFDHFRTIIEEATADLVVMFHDDDLLCPDYVATLRAKLESNSSLGAVACDATILRGDTPTRERFGPHREHDIELRTPEQLLAEYFSLSIKGPAPFPGYMYRRSHIQGLSLDPRHGGKYSDVSFLLKVLRRGAVLWLREPHMQYRIHGHNDSATEAVGQRLRLLRFVFTATPLNRGSVLVEQYRYRYWMSWWRAQSATHRKMRRARVVRRFLVGASLRYFLTRSEIWARAFAKLSRAVQQILPPRNA